jgi:hypothetical protein
LQGIAAPNTLVISAATFQLLGGFFACQPLGTPLLKGLAQPLAVCRVLYESMARSRLEAAGSTGRFPPWRSRQTDKQFESHCRVPPTSCQPGSPS